MLSKVFRHNTGENYRIRLALVFALVFAVAHVGLHDLNINTGLEEQNECQVCRLNHVPVASLSSHSLITSQQFLTTALRVAKSEYQLSLSSRNQWARAPPLYRS